MKNSIVVPGSTWKVAFLEKFYHLDHGPAKKFVFLFENKKNGNLIEIFFGGTAPELFGRRTGDRTQNITVKEFLECLTQLPLCNPTILT